MPQLLARHWRIIAKALRFVRRVCEDKSAQEVLDLIGEEGEKAAPPDQELSDHENN